jgi:hypothetical protein
MEETSKAIGDEASARVFYLAETEPEILNLISEARKGDGEAWAKMKAMLMLMRQDK